jgi:LuxR family maltose regulon positive regulatory protein
VALVLAPAGYGKTTLLADWAAADDRPFAWVRLSATERDPLRLVSALATALEAIEPVGWEVFEALSSGRHDAAAVALQRLARALARKEHAFVLAIDDLHSLPPRVVLPVLQAIWQAVPAGAQLALAARGDAGLPVGRLRAHRSSIELRAADLALTRSEAGALLRMAGLALEPHDVLTLLRRTDGWPAGLYLAALSLSHQGREGRVAGFAGDDRYVSEYVREEVLAGLAAKRLEFLMQTSVFDRLTGPLCDAVLGRSDSAKELEALAHANVPIAVLDRNRTAYRYNPLFADVLRSELRRLEPGRDAWLHRRASARLSKQGDTDRALRHAIEAADLPRAGRLLWDCTLDRLARGRGDEVAAVLDRFSHEQVARTPLLALVAASASLARGRLDEADGWTTVAAGGQPVVGSSPRRDPAGAGVALMRAWIGRAEVGQIGADATRAETLLEAKSPWRPLCGFLRGVALHLEGDPEAARLLLEEAGHRAAATVPLVQALCLAQLALAALDAGDSERAAVLASRARAQLERFELQRCPLAALVFSICAWLHARSPNEAEALADLEQALELVARFTDPSPWYEAECRLALADAAVFLNRPTVASEQLAKAESASRRVSGGAVPARWLAETRGRVEQAASAGAAVHWNLTDAELRVLGYLPSHLCFREIAERLYVSSNTVKTHARAIYRKLGASSRGEAVDRARGAGLVEPAVGG